MHPVGDIADVQLVGKTAVVQVLEHVAGDAAMDAAHAVHLLTETAGEDAHRELLLGIGGALATQSHKLLPADVEQVGEAREIDTHHILAEGIVASGNGRVGGEQRGGFHQLHGLGERQMLALHQHTGALQREERGMSLVKMENLGLLPYRIQQPHTADT